MSKAASEMDEPRFEPVKSDSAQLVRDMVSMWQAIARQSADIAHARRTLFLAYLAEGFSEVQALELVKTP